MQAQMDKLEPRVALQNSIIDIEKSIFLGRIAISNHHKFIKYIEKSQGRETVTIAAFYCLAII